MSKLIREVYDDNFRARLQLRQREESAATYLTLVTDSPNYSPPSNILCYARPISYHVRVTNKCNLCCPYCYAEDGRKTVDMTDDQIGKLIKDSDENGALMFSWTGGEPLLRTGIFEFIAETHRLGINQTLLTNGTLLDRMALSKLPRSNFILQVGFNEPWSTDVPAKRNHDRILKNVRCAVECGFPVWVTVTLDPQHINMLPKLLLQFKENKIYNVKIGLLLPIGKLKGLDYQAYAAQIKLVLTTIGAIRSKFRDMNIVYQYDYSEYSKSNLIPKRFLQCEAGISQIYVDNNGDVFPCPLFKSYQEFYCGNFFEQSIDALWNSQPMENLRKINAHGCDACGNLCDVWCRALQYELTGSVSGKSKLCPLLKG